MKKLDRFSLKMIFVVFASFCFLIACAPVKTSLSANSHFDSSKAYLFGNFQLKGSKGAGIVLNMRKLNGTPKEYGFKFKPQKDLYVIAVQPGQYQLNKYQYVDGSNMVLRHVELDGDAFVKKTFTAEAGKAYYIGDWHGSSTLSGGYSYTSYNWSIDKVNFNFASAVESFKEKYSNLITVEFIAPYEPDYSGDFNREDPSTYNTSDLIKAMQYMEYDLAYKMATEMSDKDGYATFVMGYMYEKGINVEKDVSKSIEYYTQALKLKNSDAMFHLGTMLFTATKSDDNEKQAKNLVTGLMLVDSAAVYGNIRAISLLCSLGTTDKFPPTLKAMGLAWCYKGREFINEENKSLLGDRLDAVMNPVPVSEELKVDFDRSFERISKRIAEVEEKQ